MHAPMGQRRLPHGWAFVPPLLFLLCSPLGLAAQAIQGRLLDDQTDDPIIGASVLLLNPDGDVVRSVLSDGNGAFLLQAPRPDRFRIRAHRIGYREVTSAPMDVVRGEVVEVELRASTQAVPLAPLTIISDRPALRRNLKLVHRGYYERSKRWGEEGMGFGHFLERDDIQRRVPSRVSDVVRGLPGVRVRGVGGWTQVILMRAGHFRCSPTVYLDGHRFATGADIDEWISPHSLAAVEVYPGLAGPGEYGGGCGSIVLWTGGDS